jgi:hypothetical protein
MPYIHVEKRGQLVELATIDFLSIAMPWYHYATVCFWYKMQLKALIKQFWENMNSKFDIWICPSN